MNANELHALIARTLSTIAPEADLTALAGSAPLRDALDLDSMDFLNFLVALNKATGVEIPEKDYTKLQSLDALVAYLAPRVRKE